MWDRLFARQVDILSTHAAPAFLGGIDVLRMRLIALELR